MRAEIAKDYLGVPIYENSIVLYARGGTHFTGFYGRLWRVLKLSAKSKGSRLRIEPYPYPDKSEFKPTSVEPKKLVVYHAKIIIEKV